MNPKAEGALEALSWVKTLMASNLTWDEIKQAIDDAVNDILNGVAVDFRGRIKAISRV